MRTHIKHHPRVKHYLDLMGDHQIEEFDHEELHHQEMIGDIKTMAPVEMEDDDIHALAMARSIWLCHVNSARPQIKTAPGTSEIHNHVHHHHLVDWKWLAIIGLLILASLILAPKAHAQGIDCINFWHSGDLAFFKNYCAPFNIMEGTGMVFSVDGSNRLVMTPSGGVALAGGSNGQVQYNNATALGGVSGTSVSGGSITVGSPFFLPDGAAGAPALSFSGGTTVGMYRVLNAMIFTGNAAGDKVVFNYDFGGQMKTMSGGGFCFSSSASNPATAGDGCMSRLGSASFAFGNNTPGDVSGTIKATIGNFVTGIQINGAATTGNVLRGNGTNFISAQLAYSDISGTPTLPVTKTAAAGQPLLSYDSTTGAFTQGALTATNVGLGSVTNDAQTKAAIVPNTAPSAGQILAGNAGGTAYAPVSMSQDATMSSAGVVTVTKTNNVAFAASATTDTTNAANISSGTLPAGRMPAFGGDFTSTVNTATAALSPNLLKISCEGGLGDGLNAITAGTYLQTTCYNGTGATITISGIKCLTDNSGTSTMNVTNGVGTGLLTGAVTCTSSYASGTQSGTVTIASGDFLKFTFVADGTSKQTDWVMLGSRVR